MQYSEILGLSPKQVLFQLLRQHSRFDEKGVTIDKVTIGEAKVTTANSRNAEVTVYPTPGSGLVNPITVYYNRLDLGTLGTNADNTYRWPLYVESDDGFIKVSDLLSLIASTYGIVLAKEDIVDATIDSVSVPRIFDVVPTGSNAVWFGVLPFEILVGSKDLNLLIRNTIMDGLHYLSDDVTRVQGPVVSYTWFLPKDALLKDGKLPDDGKVLQVGDVYAEQLAAVMNDAGLGLIDEIEGTTDGDKWVVSDTPSAFNLKDAVVRTDIGFLNELPFGIRADAGRVVAIALSESNTFIGGYITLYEAA